MNEKPIRISMSISWWYHYLDNSFKRQLSNTYSIIGNIVMPSTTIGLYYVSLIVWIMARGISSVITCWIVFTFPNIYRKGEGDSCTPESPVGWHRMQNFCDVTSKTFHREEIYVYSRMGVEKFRINYDGNKLYAGFYELINCRRKMATLFFVISARWNSYLGKIPLCWIENLQKDWIVDTSEIMTRLFFVYKAINHEVCGDL